VQPTTIPLEGFLNPETLVGDFGIQPGMQIADLGCGTGHIGILMAQRVGENGRVTAVDIMEDKLDSIRTRAKAAGLANLDTVRADLEVSGSTGLPDHSQDMTVLVNVLFQSQKKAEIIKEAKRVLKPGSNLIVVDWKKGPNGLGPPDELRTDSEEMKLLVSAEDFVFSRAFNAGKFHYGLIFKKG